MWLEENFTKQEQSMNVQVKSFMLSLSFTHTRTHARTYACTHTLPPSPEPLHQDIRVRNTNIKDLWCSSQRFSSMYTFQRFNFEVTLLPRSSDVAQERLSYTPVLFSFPSKGLHPSAFLFSWSVFNLKTHFTHKIYEMLGTTPYSTC